MRKGHLDVTLATFGAQVLLGKFRALTIDGEVQTEDGRAVTQRHQLDIPVGGRTFKFMVEELITSEGAGAIRQSGLNVTVFTIAGSLLLGRFKSGSLKVTTVTDDGAGGADEWQYPTAQGTDYSVDGEFQIADTALFNSLMLASGISGLLTTAAISVGGIAFAAPMTLKTSGQGVRTKEIQTERATLTGRGTPTTATGNTFLTSILLGSASVAYSVNSGAGSYYGDALITDSTLNFAGKQLVSASHTFQAYGQPSGIAP
ncbi:hypothetical protein EON81_10735 [bacterium]|nr:MAG: hypothetical protein EON81_10735 [bacterium]